jgi:hypothetical protein
MYVSNLAPPRNGVTVSAPIVRRRKTKGEDTNVHSNEPQWGEISSALRTDSGRSCAAFEENDTFRTVPAAVLNFCTGGGRLTLDRPQNLIPVTPFHEPKNQLQRIGS